MSSYDVSRAHTDLEAALDALDAIAREHDAWCAEHANDADTEQWREHARRADACRMAIHALHDGQRQCAAAMRPDMDDADALLRRIHERVGLGIDMQTFTDGSVEVQWFRDYGEGGWSDRRWVSGPSLCEALRAVLAWEDDADARDAEEAAWLAEDTRETRTEGTDG